MSRIDAIAKFLVEKSPEIFTGLSIVGVVNTAVLAVKATPKAMDRLDEAYSKKGDKLTKPEVVKAAYKCYIPTAISGAVTIGFVLAANKAHLKKEAGLAAALSWFNDRYKDYKDEVAAKFGEETDREIESSIAQKQMVDNPPPGYLKKYAADDGKFLCYEPITDQYFMCTKSELIWAELTANKMFQFQSEVTVNQILKLFPGCVTTKPIGNKYGWCMDSDHFEYMGYNWGFYGTPWIDIRPEITVMDGQEVMVINFSIGPTNEEFHDITEVISSQEKQAL